MGQNPHSLTGLLKVTGVSCSRHMNSTVHFVPSFNLHISQSSQTLHKCFVSQAIKATLSGQNIERPFNLKTKQKQECINFQLCCVNFQLLGLINFEYS